MGERLQEHKRLNKDKIRLGTCIELIVLLDNFVSDFKRLENFISDNADLFNNQSESIIKKQFDDSLELITDNIDILLNDIDKEEIYCQYMNRYY